MKDAGRRSMAGGEARRRRGKEKEKNRKEMLVQESSARHVREEAWGRQRSWVADEKTLSATIEEEEEEEEGNTKQGEESNWESRDWQ